MRGFIGAQQALAGAAIALFGAPYDGTASFRPGTRFGPNASRDASDGLETYSPAQDADLEQVVFADLGDIELGFGAAKPAIDAVREMVERILDGGAKPFMLGGEHSLTAGAFAAVREAYPDVSLVQLDAHADLRDDYLGDPNSHACVMRRCLDLGCSLYQFGIRSGTVEEWRQMRTEQTLYHWDDFGDVLSALSGPVYLTVDIDVFDPSIVPGTGTPEPGGIGWNQFEEAIAAIGSAQAQIVGLDVMELAPRLDLSGVSSVVAAKCVRELLLAI